jgi:hypothetical protein
MEIYMRNPWNRIYLEYIGQKTNSAMQKVCFNHNYIFCLVMVVTKRRWSVL